MSNIFYLIIYLFIYLFIYKNQLWQFQIYFFSRISSVEDYVWQSSILCCCAFVLRPTTFTQGVKVNVELKSSIPIGVKVENSPKQGLYTRSQS